MNISYSIAEIRSNILIMRNIGKSIALVPTMGALHEGHLHLINSAKNEYDVVICSIFVNPLQFNSSSDFDLYPRYRDKDISTLKSSGCDVLFMPSVSDMYSTGSIISIKLGKLDTVLEGKHRPGHFSGVSVVVSKLFNIVSPDAAYFGQKDLQQLAVIRLLVNDLSFQVTIKEVATIRDEKGLALSSRNERLSSKGKESASKIFEVLKFCKTQLLGKEEIVWFTLKEQAIKNLLEYGITVEYLELADKYTFDVLEELPVKSADSINSLHLCIAAWVEEVRLIDNIGLIP